MTTPTDDPLLALAFDRAARTHADSPAVIDTDGTLIQYSALRERADDAAARLARAIGGPGTVVALIAHDPVSTLTWMLGALRAGASVTTITPIRPERDSQLRIVGPDLTVACGANSGGIRQETEASGRRLPPGIVVCTAGTTGAPKAVVHSHATLAHAVRRLQLSRLEAAGSPGRVPTDDGMLKRDLLAEAATEAFGLRYATTLPLTTMAGLTVALQALLAGDCLVVAPTTDAVGLVRAIATSGVTNLSLTPLLAQLMLRAAAREALPRLDCLAFAGIGGGPVAPGIPEALEVALGCPVAVGYGTTEAGGALTMGRISDPPDVRHRSVGRSLPGVQLTADSRTHELVARCASIAIGYLSSRGALTELPRSEYRTGDLGHVRPDGAIEHIGRADGLILRGGRNVDPVRIERALEDHAAVAHAAVFGVGNRTIAGEQDIWSVVVLDGPVTEAELRGHCNAALGPVLTPRRIVAVDALPRTPDGSVRRHELAALAGSRPQLETSRS